MIALAVLAIVVLFRRGRFIMNSMEGSQTIPMYVAKLMVCAKGM